MLEILALTVLAVPEDPGKFLEHVHGDPEVLLAAGGGRGGAAGGRGGGFGGRGGGRGGGAGAKLSPRAGEILESRGKFLRELRRSRSNLKCCPSRHSERERRRLLHLYGKVRVYYSTVPPTLTIGGIVALLSTPFTVFLPLRRALNRAWERRYGPRFRGGDPLWYLRYLDEVRRFNERIAGRFWAISALSLLTVVAEGELSYQAAYAFADAVVEGGEPLGAFYEWAVLGMKALLAVYAAASVVIVFYLTGEGSEAPAVLPHLPDLLAQTLPETGLEDPTDAGGAGVDPPVGHGSVGPELGLLGRELKVGPDVSPLKRYESPNVSRRCTPDSDGDGGFVASEDPKGRPPRAEVHRTSCSPHPLERPHAQRPHERQERVQADLRYVFR